MHIIKEAFQNLYPEKELEYEISIKYTDRFKPYNANVRLSTNNLRFNLSKKWRTISREIQIDLIQSLLVKIIKENKKTTNIDLYNIFMKNIHIAAPKTKSNPILEESFNKVNEKYFYGLIEKPNLIWCNSSTKLGSYEFGTDTIAISKIFQNEKNIMDYIMYHEILHKKHKFKSKNGRNYHHTREFRKKEREFENSKEIERTISKLTRKTRQKLTFRRFFGL